MKIVILYESLDPRAKILYEALSGVCSAGDNTLDTVDASLEELKACIGCFACWIKTPGICIHNRDGGNAYLRKIYDADYFVVLSRITWGGYSIRIKSYIDRLLPLLHPYFRKLNGEMHHKLRYEKMPVLLAAGFGAAGDNEENTFREYINAHSDNMGKRFADNSFILGSSHSENELPDREAVSACVKWFEKEVII